MSLFFRICRIILGLTFVVASIDKIANPAAFADAVYNYRILPDMLITPVALLLPYIELVCGVHVMLNRKTPAGTAILVLLTIIFIAAIGFNIQRGLNTACGCFSTEALPGQLKSEMLQVLYRDIGLLLLGLLVMAQDLMTSRKSTY